ncbi:MAG: glycosyltransferase, partial [Chitinivibrionales bacterium]|nr:glycosyltransferase [Chitinivibrionales bacterium]MBD3358358.1 glycosyltransferase [Chitinivibrionales bacterium]
VIVDDGSTDETGRIADNFARGVRWLQVVHRVDRGFREAGGGVIEAFDDGFAHIAMLEWDFIVKLDGDLSFGPRYFETLLDLFENEPSLGIGGGDVYSVKGGAVELERQPRFHVRGATKMYRRACWEAVGGLLRAPGWDTLDEVKAHMAGFSTRSFPQLRVMQHKPTGSADGTWRNAVKNGRANWIAGYHPLFVTAKCTRRIFRRPYFLGALGVLTGFVQGYLSQTPQVEDRELIRYLRRQQINKLMLRPTIWR